MLWVGLSRKISRGGRGPVEQQGGGVGAENFFIAQCTTLIETGGEAGEQRLKIKIYFSEE